MSDILNNIFNCLDMTEQNGLASDESLSSMSGFQLLFYKQVKDKLGIDAVFFLRDESGVAKIPLIYFSFVDDYNPEKIAELHKLSWNLGEAPLLFVVTPTELKIYNNYLTPKRKDGSLDPTAGIIETIGIVADLEEQRKKLSAYNRTLLESGEYWSICRERFNTDTRIDTTLMNNLRVMRQRLINKISIRKDFKDISSKNIVSIVHGLLSRSIFIKYLEERKDSSGKSVFPIDFYNQFSTANASYSCYTDILSNKDATYTLFNVLEKKFNGDMLPLVEKEQVVVTQDDLLELQSFLIGDMNFATGQMALWSLYDFNIIPIQIISSIYELFFHLSEKEDDKGTYYTPLHLVDTLLDEIYPWEGIYEPVSILDPACGSGIFLVEIYRRLVCRWMQTNSVSQINNAELTALLDESIFGIDLNVEAVRVASFSLSLALCDFLDPRSIWNELVLPKLVNKNLIVNDFFEEEMAFENVKYDIVVGNPPWQSKLTEPAVKYLKKKNYTIGDNQIAQAFSLKCSDFCKDDGLICLLMPSKGFLFNRSGKSEEYRRTFFSANSVSVIINFSIYRKTLFDNATAPSVAVVYSPAKSADNGFIYYCTPKPHYSVQDSRKFSIDPTDICKIPLDMIHDDRIWKIAMWGSPRDLELIDRLQCSAPSLKVFLHKNNMICAEGFIRGDKRDAKAYKELLNYPILDAKHFVPLYTPKDFLVKNINDLFLRPRIKNAAIYKSPHLVIKKSPKNGQFISTVIDYDAIFCHSFLGVSGEESLLKYVSIIINSKLFTYYQLLTSRNWMVERDALEASDIRNMPIPIPDENVLRRAEEIYKSIISGTNTSTINDFVFDIYKMKKHEVALVDDAINYTYNYFDRKYKSKSLKKPSKEIYGNYFSTFQDVLKNSIGHDFISNVCFYIGNAPLTVLMISIDNSMKKELQFINSDQELEKLLDNLDNLLVEKKQCIYIRRNVKIYGQDTIYIVKPTQEKFWNYTSACRDADEIFMDVSKMICGRN